VSERFRPVRDRRGRRGRVSVTLGEVEISVLRQLLEELLALLGEEEEGGEDAGDPLAAAVGIGRATRRPEDPVLARLFPDGYTDDPEAAADFRRYTERGLRERKRAAATTVLATLAGPPGKRVLEPDQAQAWLGALNDLRLALGERLGVTEDLAADLARVPEDDPRHYAWAVYDLLTFLQDSLVRALE
jgi:Domain of unknown function (DUF2017)